MKNKIKKDYGRVCIVDTQYSLLIYLLFSSLEEIEDTFFFFQDSIPKNVRDSVPHFTLKVRQKNSFLKNLRRCYMLYLRYVKYLKWNFLKRAKIFAQDHLAIAFILLFDRDYYLLEDGYGNYIEYEDLDRTTETLSDSSLLKDVIRKYLFYPRTENFGRGKNCKGAYLTKEFSVQMSAHTDKEYIVCKLQKLWNEAPKEKKELIHSVYGLTPSDLEQLQQCSSILLTQCFSDDGYFSEEEQIAYYKKIVEHYGLKDFIIKKHPRETVQYEKYFPDAYVFNKPLPMELFNLLGLHFSLAVTINSTAISSINADKKIICAKTIDEFLQKKRFSSKNKRIKH